MARFDFYKRITSVSTLRNQLLWLNTRPSAVIRVAIQSIARWTFTPTKTYAIFVQIQHTALQIYDDKYSAQLWTNCAMCNTHCAIRIVQYTLCNTHCPIHIVQYTLYNSHCVIHIVYFPASTSVHCRSSEWVRRDHWERCGCNRSWFRVDISGAPASTEKEDYDDADGDHDHHDLHDHDEHHDHHHDLNSG